MNKKITAVIPVRKGSVRVKNKNIRDFGGTSLLELKIDLLKTVVGLDKIVLHLYLKIIYPSHYTIV